MVLSMLDQQNQALDEDAENNSATALARKVSFLSRPESYKPTADNVVARNTPYALPDAGRARPSIRTRLKNHPPPFPCVHIFPHLPDAVA
jgi:hypothetical protein